MLTQSHIEGGWTELKGKVKQVWGELNDDELREFEGDLEQLVGYIQRSTGEAQEEVELRLAELDARFRPMLEQFSQTARDYYNQTIESTTEAAERFRQQVAERQAQAEAVVRRRPFESVAIALGAGLVTGLVVGILSSRSR